MLALALTGLLVSFLVACLILVGYIRWNYGTLEKLGIPVIKPHFLLGSSPNRDTILNHEEDYKWFKQYGEVFGVYEGRTPKIYICDPEIIKQIWIKESHKFPDRSFIDSLDFVLEFMDFVTGEKWKTLRSSFTPIFTSSKLKKLSRNMIEVSQDFTEMIKTEIKKSENGMIEDFNLYQDIYLLLVDLIARCTLNIKVQDPRNPENEFAAALTNLFSTFANKPALIKKLEPSLPFLASWFTSKSVGNSLEFFEKIYNQVLDQRQKSGEKNDDFVDLLLDLMKKTKSEDFKRLGITERTIIANAVEFYIAGQDSMSMAVSMLFFYMTKNPQVEKKLYEEVDAYFERHNGKVTYETFNELIYLNACLQESLRLHPTFTRMDRVCTEDTEIKGIKFTKGNIVVLPLWPYNRNPKYFEDPESFNPERFMPHNKDKLNPMAVANFGWGPRMCIGMRFSQEAMIVASLHLLRNFKFATKPDAKIPYVPGVEVMAYAAYVPLNIQLR